jgi:hypothetical protein
VVVKASEPMFPLPLSHSVLRREVTPMPEFTDIAGLILRAIEVVLKVFDFLKERRKNRNHPLE